MESDIFRAKLREAGSGIQERFAGIFCGAESGRITEIKKQILLFLIFQSLKISSMHVKTMKFLSLMLGYRICDLKAYFFKRLGNFCGNG